MKVQVEEPAACARVLRIELSPEDVATHRDAVYQEFQRRVVVPGFRKGHAPRDLVELHHGAQAERDVMDRLLVEGYRGAVREAGLRPIADPEIRDVRYTQGGPCSFSARVEVRPAVRASHYRGLPATARAVTVTDAAVAEALRLLQARAATYLAVHDRPLRAGDIAVCELTCTADGQTLEQQRQVWVPMDAHFPVPELVTGLDGAGRGETRTVTVTLPADYADARLAGKAATFTVVVREVKERRLPDLNDEFAKDLGPFETLAALTAKVRADLQRREQDLVDHEIERQVLDALVGRASFEVPLSQVQRERTRLVEEALAQIPPEGRAAQRTAAEQRLDPVAQRNVRLAYLLDVIAVQEGVTVTDEELQRGVEGLRPRDPRQAWRFDQLLHGAGVTERIRGDLLVRKTIEWLVSVARVGPAS